MACGLLDVSDLVGLPERIEEVLDTAPATCMAFNPWGTLLATGCSSSGDLLLYDYQTRGPACRLRGGHAAGTDVTALLWSSDGRTLVSGARDGSLVAWDVATGRQRQQQQLSGGAITQLAWADGQRHQQQQLAQQQQAEQQAGGSQGHDAAVVLVSLSAGPAQLLSLGTGHRQELPVLSLDLEGRQLTCLSGQEAASSSGQVAVPSHDGQLIYAAARGAVMVLRRQDLALLDMVKVGGGAPRILGLELNHTGRRLLVTAADQHMRVYLAHRPGDRQPLRHEARLARAAASLATTATAMSWDSASSAITATTATTAAAAAAAATEQQGPEGWRARSLAEARMAAVAPSRGGPARSSVFYDDGAAWLTLEMDLTSGSELAQERRAWKCAAFSPDGEYFASASEAGAGAGASPGHVVYLWEAQYEARLNAVLEGQSLSPSGKESVVALCWHPSAIPMQLLSLGTSGNIYVWAKAFTENWSAFAPDFAELHGNDEYAEPEDEFDMNPKPEEQQQDEERLQQEQQRQQQQQQPQQKGEDSMEADEVDETEEVDISTPVVQEQGLTAQLAASSHGGHSVPPLLHLPLQLDEATPAVGPAPYNGQT